MKLELRYDYSGSTSGEKPERCYDIVGDPQACITFVHDGSKDAIARIEAVVQIVNGHASELAALERIAKGNPAPRVGGWLTDVEMADIARKALVKMKGGE